MFLSQTGAALFHYKLGETLLQTVAAQFLQIGTSFVRDWGKVLQIRTTIITK